MHASIYHHKCIVTSSSLPIVPANGSYCILYSFEVEKFCGFSGSIGNRKTFPVKQHAIGLGYARLPSNRECFPANYSLVLQPLNFFTLNDLQYTAFESPNLIILNYLAGSYLLTVVKSKHFISQACKLALDEGWAINIGGGFSHYSANNTIGGLHIYDDVLLCLAVS